MERPCGIVFNVKEVFGSESKSQVYAHIHNLLEKAAFDETSKCCFKYNEKIVSYVWFSVYHIGQDFFILLINILPNQIITHIMAMYM